MKISNSYTPSSLQPTTASRKYHRDNTRELLSQDLKATNRCLVLASREGKIPALQPGERVKSQSLFMRRFWDCLWGDYRAVSPPMMPQEKVTSIPVKSKPIYVKKVREELPTARNPPTSWRGSRIPITGYASNSSTVLQLRTLHAFRCLRPRISSLRLRPNLKVYPSPRDNPIDLPLFSEIFLPSVCYSLFDDILRRS
ncbi:hypothetical protein AAMO2058_000297100 [Amorphochlora amoebiformis]